MSAVAALLSAVAGVGAALVFWAALAGMRYLRAERSRLDREIARLQSMNEQSRADFQKKYGMTVEEAWAEFRRENDA